jgi:hypothetical protein
LWTGIDLSAPVGTPLILQSKGAVTFFNVRLMSRKNSGNSKVLSRCADFFCESKFEWAYSRPKKSLISNVKLNIELSKPLSSQNKVVASEVEDQHWDILLSMSVDFKVEHQDFRDRLSRPSVVSFHGAGL